MPPHRRPVRDAAIATTLLVAAVAASACQSSGDEPGTTARSGSATGSPSASTSASATPSATPSSTVAPASGPLLQLTRASVHAPDGWRRMKDLVKFQKDAEDPAQIATTLSVNELPAAPRSLESEARGALAGYPVKPKVVANVTAGGVEMYHVAGKINDYQWVDQFGAFHAENAFTITFTFGPGVTPKARKAAYEATLASIEWR